MQLFALFESLKVWYELIFEAVDGGVVFRVLLQKYDNLEQDEH